MMLCGHSIFIKPLRIDPMTNPWRKQFGKYLMELASSRPPKLILSGALFLDPEIRTIDQCCLGSKARD